MARFGEVRRDMAWLGSEKELGENLTRPALSCVRRVSVQRLRSLYSELRLFRKPRNADQIERP